MFSAGIRLYIGSLAFGALALGTYLFFAFESVDPIQFTLFLLLFLVAESKPVLLPKSRVALTVTFIIVIVAMIEMSPFGVAVASGLCVVASRPEGRWLDRWKMAFNSAQYALAGGLAALAYRALGGTARIPSGGLGRILIATTAATSVYFIVNTAAVSGAIAISTRSPFVKTWLGSHGWLAATYIAFGASGLVLASLYEVVGILALPLLFVPLLVARSVFRSYQEVTEAYDSTVKTFVRAMEAKDTYTSGHSERVAGYAKRLAERAGMSGRDLEVFYYGAILHDIGKIVVRKSTLNKPGRLDDAEFAEIKRHPVVGAQIVREIEFLRPSLEAVLYHHERLDGSGYPAGLEGDGVPDLARIMAVADTYDAMTSTRAYRGPSTNEETIAELRRCSGTLLDPHYVAIFLKILDEQAAVETVEQRVAIREVEIVPNAAG